MLVILSIAAAASFAVIAYTRLREHSPAAGDSTLRAVRELADIVLVCSKAIEGVVDVLAGTRGRSPIYRDTYNYDDYP